MKYQYAIHVVIRMTYRPEFKIDDEMLNLVSEIMVALGRIIDRSTSPSYLRLKQANKVRSIHSSLAIEGNTLSLEKVTDIINGKRVLGDPREIQEVKGANEAYDMVEALDPYSIEDLLRAHGAMTRGLVDHPGRFRYCGVGVYKGNVPVHIAPDHEEVPGLIDDLMAWARDSDVHPLVKGCIFHCRFEYIHPFVDGNGRIGRLWHSLILSKWRAVFECIPIEAWIKLNQNEYYDALTRADRGDLENFIKFMLRMIHAAINEFVEEIRSSRRISGNESAVIDIIKRNPRATSAEMAKIIGVSDRTIKRYLSSLTEKGMLKREGSDKTGKWKLI